MNENPKEFDTFVIKSFKLTNKYYKYIKPNYNITVSLTNSMYDSIKIEGEWLVHNKIIENSKSKNYLNLINSDILKEIDPSLVNLLELK